MVMPQGPTPNTPPPHAPPQYPAQAAPPSWAVSSPAGSLPPVSHDGFAAGPIDHSAMAPISQMPPMALAAQQATKAGFPVWLKVVASLVSILKAIPIVLVALAGFGLAAAYGGAGEVGVILVLIALIPLGVLLWQMVAALGSSRVSLIIAGALLSALDLLIVVGSVVEVSDTGNSGALVVFGLMFLFQVSVLIGAISSTTRIGEAR